MAERVIAEMLHLVPEHKKPIISIVPLPPAQADARLMLQVWVNLLSTAVKYSGGATILQIQVTGKIIGDNVVYSARYNGAGFDLACYEKLFEMFSRFHTTKEFAGILG